MIARATRNATPYDARMLAMADRLFREFDTLPVHAVLGAIGAARAEIREQGEPRPEPERVETMARAALRLARASDLAKSRRRPAPLGSRIGVWPTPRTP